MAPQKKEGRKQFFFEKKNQKTFNCLTHHGTQSRSMAAGRNRSKFFGSVFSKKNRFLP
jgi:hypothetical protein